MKIAVAGADGGIGSILTKSLAAAGHEVFGTVFRRAPARNEAFLDLSRPETFRNLPAGPFDAVVNAAGLVDQSLPGNLIRSVNALGTRRLADWARSRGCGHFVFLSSVSVYGLLTMGRNRRERTPVRRFLAPFPYMRSKIEAERCVERCGLPYTILRLPPVLGEGDSYLTPAVVSALRSGRFFFAGRGDRLVSVMTLGGLGRAAEALLAHGPLNAAYNCVDHHVPWRELVAEYSARLGVPLPGRRRTVFSMLPLLGDKPALLLFAFSLFGAHFPDEALHRVLPHDHEGAWREAVAEAVEGMQREIER
ncbi:MAG: NAD(P)-dependent oxidoreductase [Spirochaetales bacterium]|nr:NAD(P)-dependent oxidoreductase [Spirochaetales bacterium]